MPLYRRAPIVEAIVEIAGPVGRDVTIESLKEVLGEQAADFDTPDPITQSEFSMPLGIQPASEKQLGWAFKSKHGDSPQIVQSRLDRFVFSQLAPYDCWDTFRDAARSFWDRYREISHTSTISRLGLRYVNRLNIPLPLRDFDDYLKTLPEISEKMNTQLSGYFMSLQIPYPEYQAMLNLMQTIVPPPQTGQISVILDIDFVCANYSSNDFDAAWLQLDRLREAKNNVFEACITDKTRALLEVVN